MVNPTQIAFIYNQINELSQHCTSKEIFFNQLKLLMHQDGKHSMEEIIILFNYIFNHIHYILESNNSRFINTMNETTVRLINHIHQLNQQSDTNEITYPKNLRNIAIDILTRVHDALTI
jgi:hypothetical protein